MRMIRNADTMKIVYIVLSLIPMAAFSATYYVDPGRTSNGDGTEANPYKHWGDVSWGTVRNTLSNEDFTVYFSSQASEMWNTAFYPLAGATGTTNGWLYLIGDEKYNLTASGTAVWLTETNGNRHTLTNNGGAGGSANLLNNQAYITIQGFYLDTPTDGGINLGTGNPTTGIHDIIIQNCVIESPKLNHGIWMGYGETGCHSITVRGNTVTNTSLEGIYLGHYNYFGNGITNCLVESNTLVNCGKGSEGDIDIKPAVSGAIIRYNTHYRTAGVTAGANCGVVVAANDVQVYGNEFYESDQNAGNDWGFGVFVNSDGDGNNGQVISNCWIYNNLLYSNDRAGIKATATKTDSGADIQNLYIWNNLIANNGTYGIQLTTSNGKTITATIQNNIIGSNTNYDVYSAGDHITLCNNNLYYGPPTFYYNGSARTWAQWQALTWDANGSTNAPTFDTGWQLASGSTGIDDGATIAYFSIDINGVTRPINDTWDMGAYEWSSFWWETHDNTSSGLRIEGP